MTVYAAPGQPGSLVTFACRYDNWIGGERVAPGQGPVLRERHRRSTARPFCEVARSTAEDVELALDAAHAAAPRVGQDLGHRAQQHPAARSPTGWRPNLEKIAVAETWDNGKPVRETLGRRHPAGDRPLPLLRRCAAGPGGLASRRSTRTPSPTTSTSRSASSGRSSRGTSRS